MEMITFLSSRKNELLNRLLFVKMHYQGQGVEKEPLQAAKLK